MTPVGEISPASYTPTVSTLMTTAPNADFVLLSFVTAADNVLALLFETDLPSFSGSTFVTNPVPLPHGQVQSQLICVSGAAGCTLELGVLDYEPIFTSGIATPLVSQNVAEPGSLSLVAAGLAGLAMMLRIVRRRSAVWLTRLPA